MCALPILISPGLSTRITFPLVPLPYCRTQRDTVPLPLMPYFREMASKASPPNSNSRTTSILKASLYRISSRLPCVFVFMPDNLFQDGTHANWSYSRPQKKGLMPSKPHRHFSRAAREQRIEG